MGVTGCYGVHICEVPGRRVNDEHGTSGERRTRIPVSCRPVTGAALVGLNQADDQTVDNVKIGVKRGPADRGPRPRLCKRDDETVDKRLFGLVGLFTTANIFIAVLWT